MRIKVPTFAASLLLAFNSSAGIPQSTSVTTSSPRAATLLALSATALSGSTIAQTPTTSASSTQGLATLQAALIALVGRSTVSDVTLTGTAERIAGSDYQSGSATFKALANGSSRLDLSLSSGPLSEIRAFTSSGTSGSWSGPDGVAHAMACHNVVTDSGLFPIFTLGMIASGSNWTVTLVGQETRNGQSVIHLSASQQFPQFTGDDATLMQHLSQMDIFLDPATSLPVSVDFNIHPDKNALLDIPVEIRFSGYRSTGSVQLPFHVQKFINNSLSLDLQFQSAAINSGLTDSSFSL